MIEINIHDTIKGIGKITRVSEHFVWVDSKRYSHKTAYKKGILYYSNPNIKVDWSLKEKALNFYNSFEIWHTTITMGENKEREIFEIKDNLILHDGEYYVPWNYREKKVYEDGYIWGFLIKKKDRYIEYKGGVAHEINVFVCSKHLTQDDIDKQKQKEINKEKLSTLEYLYSIKNELINSNDLSLFKDNFIKLFDENIFPYTVNGVTFSLGNRMFSNKISMNISHRNRSGVVDIDNSYPGPLPYSNDYRIMIRTNPDFTNVSKYYTTIDRNISFDEILLDRLSKQIVSTWDMAIEDNARIYG